MFDEKTMQEMKNYVYFLKDPLEKLPFYVGKGKDNRVFDHLNCAIENDEKSEKLDKIREIMNRKKNNKVEHIILRHGLTTENEAYIIEASMIDFFRYLDRGLTNIQGGQHSIEKGLMTSDEIIRHYNTEPLREMESDCIIININKSYKRGMGDEGIYNATKGCWVAAKSRLVDESSKEIKVKYVLSEYRGLVVEVFEVTEWYQEERGFGPNAINHGKTRLGMCFEGKIASEDIRKKYINKSIPRRRGASNVIRYNI